MVHQRTQGESDKELDHNDDEDVDDSMTNFRTGIQDTAAAHHTRRIRGLHHVLLAGDLPAQPGAAGLLPGHAQVPDEHTAALRGLHPARVPQERAAAHRTEHGAADDNFTQSAWSRGLQALCQWRSG